MYSRYEINQMQRAKERNVRKWKKTWMIEKEAGLDATTSAIRLRNARKSLSDFAKATGGRVDSARTATWNTSKLPGKRFGHSEAASANWDIKKVGATAVNTTKIETLQSLPTSTPSPQSPPKATSIIGEDVSTEYAKFATPGEGSITQDEGYDANRHANEIKIAEWLRSKFGGDIRLINESAVPGVKSADFLWKGKLWDLKNTSTAKAADSAIRGGLKQIFNNPGGIILDYGDNSINIDEVLDVIASRMKRGQYETADIIIISKGEIVKILRYRK